MASNQERRESTNIEGRQVHVEKDRVPKITSHFESLTVSPASNVVSSAHDRQIQSGGETRKEDDRAKGQTVGNFEMQEKDDDQDISKYRQIAQQNSMDALRAAEERYNQGKDMAAQNMGGTKDNLAGAGNTAAEYSSQAKDYVAQKAVGAKDVAAEKAAVARDVAAQKAAAVRDVAAQKAAAARDVTAGKAAMARDVVAEKAAVAKDVVTEKAAVAKDMTVETGKGTAGFVGKVAADVKDKTVMAGWGAAEYTAEKVVGATKAVAGATAGAAGYVGDKAVAAKDVVGSAGVTAKDYAAQKLAAAKDAVVSTEESAKEYAARKRAEKERELQARKLAESKGEVWSGGETTEEKHDIAGGTGEALETAKDAISKPVQKAGEYFHGQPGYEREGQHGGGETKYREAQQGGGNGGGVLHAIGETIVEIGQTTKDLLVGQGKGGSTDQCK